jgi:ribosomal subunit interface protein
MRLPLQITFRDMLPLPAVEPAIRRRAEKLDQWTPDVMSCHVVVEGEANRHRQGHRYRLHITVRVPEDEIVASTHHLDEDIQRAIHGGFDAIDRQLEDYERRRRGQTKPHHGVQHGHIEWLADDGTGRIAGANGETYHFDRSHVTHPTFDRLRLDQAVRFLEGATRAGREARRITAVEASPALPE